MTFTKQTAREAGKRGAATLKERHGKAHFVAMGKAGGKANLERHGREHFQALGRAGARKRWGKEKGNGGPGEGEDQVGADRGGRSDKADGRRGYSLGRGLAGDAGDAGG